MILMSRTIPILALLVFMNASSSADLDTLVEPAKPTVRSEVYRGTTSVFGCAMKAGVNWYAISQCGHRARDDNIQKNNATDPFLLGVYLQTWADSHIAAIGTKDQSAQRSARGWLDLLRRQQQKIGLSDSDMCSAAKMTCNVLSRMFKEASASYAED